MTSRQSIWEQFATFDNFLLAWQRTVNASSRMVNDELGLKTFAYNLDANLRDLVRQVQAEDFPYEPLADHKVYVPKPSTTLRTMSLMSFPDRIVYQALVNVVADQAHQYLVTHENQHVYGNLYAGPGKRWMLKPWKQQYDLFVRRIESLYAAGNSWIASTDVVAFYDTIDHERLLGIIGKYCFSDSRFLDLFRKCLSKWSAHNASAAMSRGIPQGGNASDFLANLFLYDIDREMIVRGYHYVRYVDDVRILGPNKPSVQRGLILFDLELKRAGLVAQVSKTSVHEVKDIAKEINRLRFLVTDPTGEGWYVIIMIPSPPKSEQAESVADYVRKTPGEQTDSQADAIDHDRDNYEYEEDIEDSMPSLNLDIDQNTTKNVQEQLRDKFLESLSLLDDSDRGKEAESSLTFCLNRLEPHSSVRQQVIGLLPRLPWRSEAVTRCLSRFKDDLTVVQKLQEFIADHDVYSWHRANALWALYQVGGTTSVKSICRDWLADTQFDWYARTVAARILTEIPGQHAFLIECLQREQDLKKETPEETSILRHQLAFGAFQRIKSSKKQLALFRLICTDKSPLVRRLFIYLLQQPECKVTWDNLMAHHQDIGELSEIIRALGISSDAPQPCFIAQTLASMYGVILSSDDLRPFYRSHYVEAVRHLRDSVSAYHQSTNAYVGTFHQFAHLTLIAFYEHVLPSEGGLFDGYAALTDRKAIKELLSRGIDTWRRLGSMRNRVDHPVDKVTKTHSKKIAVKEVEDLSKELRVSLQELFDIWLNTPLPISITAVAASRRSTT